MPHKASVEYATIMYGGGGSMGQLWIEGGAEVTLENAVFSNSGMANGCDVDNSDGAGIIHQPVPNTFALCP
ncbi:MAG: hypothetical protein QNJ97_14500 [Myxococcota bacterium]|nr:hypothetical protein [Myxococcota bacterium]